MSPDTLGVKYSELGISDHVHTGGDLGDNTASNGWTGHQSRMEIEKLHFREIARMATKFDTIPEGKGSMLDNTMIVYMSCSSSDHHCEGHDWPFVPLVRMNKRLKMGRYIEYPKYDNHGHQTIGSLYLALMQAAGLETPDIFGQLNSNLKHLTLNGPLKELAS